MYKSIVDWRDLEDKHLYRKGDKYPHDGREVSKDRIAELCGTQNKAGFAVIEAFETSDEEILVHNEEQQKKPTRGRKKAG